jgi:tetratricopeptide (TPR) repeat protein
MPRILLHVPLLLFVTATASLAVEPQMTKGFEHFYNLEYDQAIAEFRGLVAKQPDNPNYHNHLAQAILYREMFRAGALESELVSGTNPFIRRDKVNASPEAAAQFDKEINTSISLAQAAIANNPNDTGALYSLGVAHGLRANYNFLVRKAWMDSLKDATAARKAHNHVVELDPKYIDARLVQGVHDYVVGSLPWHWKMLGFIAGFRGDREEGMKTLRLVAEKGNLNQYDAQVLLAAIYRRERRPKEALPLLNGLIQRFPRNYLFRLETVQMYSDAGDKANAAASLDKIEEMKRSGAQGWGTLPLEKIYYYRGNLLFWYGDLDAAVDQLRKATSNSAGLDAHTALMAWLRLGQASDMQGQRGQAVDAYQKAIAVAPHSDVARESRRYLSSPYKRRG